MADIFNTPALEKQFLAILDLVQAHQADRELHWYIREVLTPECPRIIETLDLTANLLRFNSPQKPNASEHSERGPPVKLPLSSSKLEALKGIIVRDGAYIISMEVSIKEPHFSRSAHALKLVRPYKLKQIFTATESIDRAIELIKEWNNTLNSAEDDHTRLTDVFNRIRAEIQCAKNSLQLPTDPFLVFPKNVVLLQSFHPPLPKTISIDLYINQAEVCLDVKNLKLVREEPWCDIDKNGLSYADRIREEMKLPTSSASSFNSKQPQSQLGIKSTSRDSQSPAADANAYGSSGLSNSSSSSSLTNLNNEHRSKGKSLKSIFGGLSLRQKHNTSEYIARCVTYDNEVVMVNQKIEVSSPDPVLVSAFTKLDSIDYIVNSFAESISKTMACALES